MPTYEYECKECGKLFDLFQSIKDKPIKKCKFCGGKVDRLIGTGGGIIFKGSGFYATDYKKSVTSKNSAPSCPASSDGGCKGCPKNSA
ncbi:MAG: FmdB family zinc ribbon protein [Candidatus Omnitrophota bacterium]